MLLLGRVAASGQVHTYRTFDVTLTAASPGDNPYLNGPNVDATFTHASAGSITVKGFWDGGKTWRVRFAPTAPGQWAYVTSSPDRGLNGVKGTLKAATPSAAELKANPLLRGFLTRDGYAWRLSDGTSFLPAGDTQWSFSEEFSLGEFEQWMDALKARGLNSMLGCIWLAKYPRSGPQPFAGGEPASEQMNPAFFQRLDREIQYANDGGIIMGLVIGGFPQDSFNETGWWNHFKAKEREERWWRYCIARYAAYNVRWVLYGEVNEVPKTPWGTTWQQEVVAKAQLVRDEDPYDHPIGSHHNRVDTSSASNPNIDYIEVQVRRTELQWADALAARQYGKPVWFEEYWYEPAGKYDKDPALGIRNTHRNFVAALVFPTFGSLMRAHSTHGDFPPTLAARQGMPLKDYLLRHDVGLARMGHFVKFYAGLDLRNFSFASDLVSRGQCGRFGPDYVVFLPEGGVVNVNFFEDDPSASFAVSKMDINSGVVDSLGVIARGKSRIDPKTTTDVVLLLKRTVSRPGAESRTP